MCGWWGSQIREFFFDLNIMHHSFNQLYFCSSCKFACCCLLLAKKRGLENFSQKKGTNKRGWQSNKGAGHPTGTLWLCTKNCQFVQIVTVQARPQACSINKHLFEWSLRVFNIIVHSNRRAWRVFKDSMNLSKN